MVYRWVNVMDEVDALKDTNNSTRTLSSLVRVCKLLRLDVLPILQDETLAPVHLGHSTVTFLSKQMRCADLIHFTPPPIASTFSAWIVTVEENWIYCLDPMTRGGLMWMNQLLQQQVAAGVLHRITASENYNAAFQDGEKLRQRRENWVVKSLRWIFQEIQKVATRQVKIIVRIQWSGVCRVDPCHPRPLRCLTPDWTGPSPTIHPSLPSGLHGLRSPYTKLTIIPSLQGHHHPNVIAGLGPQLQDTIVTANAGLFNKFNMTTAVVQLQQRFPILMQKLWDDLFILAKPFFPHSSQLRALVYAAWQKVGIEDLPCQTAISDALLVLAQMLQEHPELRTKLVEHDSVLSDFVRLSQRPVPFSQTQFWTLFSKGMALSRRLDECRFQTYLGPHAIKLHHSRRMLSRLRDETKQEHDRDTLAEVDAQIPFPELDSANTVE